MSLTVEEVAILVGAVVDGDDAMEISGVAGLRDAQSGDISFLANSRYANLVEETKASAVIVPAGYERGVYSGTLLLVSEPNPAFQKIVLAYALPASSHPEVIHSSAVIATDVELGENVGLGPHVVVEPGASIGRNTRIWANCFIGRNVSIGEDCLLYPHVGIRENCILGERVILHNGTVIGSDGFGYEVDADGVRTKVQQVGAVSVGDDVEVGANCAVNRARFGMTRIGNRVKIDNLVMIAHNVVIEDDAVLIAQAGIAGSSIIRRKAILGGQVGVAGHLVIGEQAVVGAQGGVTKDVEPGSYVTGYPAMPHRKAASLQAHLNRIPKFKERIDALEKRMDALEE